MDCKPTFEPLSQVVDLADLPAIWFSAAFEHEPAGIWEVTDVSVTGGIKIQDPFDLTADWPVETQQLEVQASRCCLYF